LDFERQKLGLLLKNGIKKQAIPEDGLLVVFGTFIGMLL